MTDSVHTVLKKIDHNRYTVVGLLIVAAMGVMVFGCESKTASMINLGAQVSSTEFHAEVLAGRAELESSIAAYNTKIASFNARAESGYADIDRQNQVKLDILAVIPELAGKVPGVGAAITPFLAYAMPILSGLLLLDNRRKDGQIKERKKA